MSNEQVTFISSRLPGLVAGTYEVTVNERISGGANDAFSVTRLFQVRGERFSVRGDEIHSVFPPENSSTYGGCVPHVLFNRAMLPWLRAPGGSAPSPATWLAVLLFDASEMPPVTPVTVRDLVGSDRPISVPGAGGSIQAGNGKLLSGYLSYPFKLPGGKPGDNTCELEYGESPDDAVLAIDIPTGRFKDIAPAADDLPWLAHVREVDLTGRSASASRGGASTSGLPDVGQFAAVLGNRVTTVGDGHAVLVSLEGLADYLPRGSHAGEIGTFNSVRLVVLKQWRFTTLSPDDALLRHSLDHLCDDPASGGTISHLRIPTEIPAPGDVADALTAQAAGALSDGQGEVLARHAFAMGYVPMLHQLRSGGQDVSWYRGPLAPLPVTAPLALPLESVDSGFTYNPETGLFDVSYAAAWQFGQMVGLSDRQFSTALYAWQRGVTELAAASVDQLSISFSHLRAFIAAQAGRVADGEASAAGNAPAVLFGRILAARLAGRPGLGVGPQEVPPPEVSSWLDGLRNFKRVPLRYLIPDGRMLRSEALRFFYLDINWVNAMLDGACSIARSVGGGRISQTPWQYADASQTKITGCLIKSQIVLGWPGLKIAAFTGDTELKRLYDDQLAPGLRMLMFDGELDRLVIQEKGEGLHFGVDFDGTKYSVALRQLTGDVGLPLNSIESADRQVRVIRVVHYDRTSAGWVQRGELEDAPPSVTVDAAMRDTTLRVIDVANTAANIRQGLIAHGALGRNDKFTSAEYALETVKSIVHVTYQLDR